MTDRRSTQDLSKAQMAAEDAKRQKAMNTRRGDVECACGCGEYPERDMTYYCDIDKYFKGKCCVNRWYKD